MVVIFLNVIREVAVFLSAISCTHPYCCFRCSEQCWPRNRNESEPIDTCPDVKVMCCNKYFPNGCLSKDIPINLFCCPCCCL